MAFEKRYGKENEKIKSKCKKVQTWHYTYSMHTLIQLIEVTFTQKHVLVNRAHTGTFCTLFVSIGPVNCCISDVSALFLRINEKIALNKFTGIHCLNSNMKIILDICPRPRQYVLHQVQCTPSSVQDLLWGRKN